MPTSKTRIFFLLGLLCMMPIFARADTAADTFTNQNIDATINSDGNVQARWTVPAFTSETDIMTVPEYKDFGFTGAFSYVLTGAENEKGAIPFSHEAGDYAYVNTGYQSGSYTHNVYLDYVFKPPFRAPLLLYEFPVFSGGFFRNPKLSVKYPDNLKLLSSWPPVQKTKPAEITYPTDSAYAPHAVLLFQPDPLPNGTVAAKAGQFSIFGDSESVRRVVTAVKGLGELESVERELLDAPLPKEVVVMIADLDPVQLSFEPSGLAIPPNIMLLNRAVLAQQSDTDLKLLISHETTHLVEMGKSLFRGASYYAPWFKEGIATAVELEMRNRLLGSHAEKVEYDLVGSYSGHLFSRNELQNKYKQRFDFLFSDNAYYPAYTTYAHGALVLRHLYQEKEKNGMRELFSALQKADSTSNCDSCDSDAIVQTISDITRWNKDDILFPFRNDERFAQKAEGLVQEEEKDAEVDSLAIPYIKEKIRKYFTSDGTVSIPEDIQKSEPQKPTPPPLVTTTLPTVQQRTPVKKAETDRATSLKSVAIPPKASSAKPAVSATTTRTTATSTLPVTNIPAKKPGGIIQKITNWFKKIPNKE